MEYQSLSLKQSGAFDHQHNLKSQFTLWRIMSDLRREQGISRSIRVIKNRNRERDRIAKL